MITQVYTAQTPAATVELSRLGVDHVGVTVSQRGLPGEVDIHTGREIVAALAGGLGPDNVANAIAVVRPAGVDSLTRTSRYLDDGSLVKDLDAVEGFVKAATAAEV